MRPLLIPFFFSFSYIKYPKNLGIPKLSIFLKVKISDKSISISSYFCNNFE